MANQRNTRELLEFFRIDDEDLELLSALREPFENEAGRIVESFYQHLLQFPATRDLLRDPAVRDRLLKKQRDYLLSLTDPVIDDAYVEERLRIGATHERVGLDTKWYLGAYSYYAGLLLPIIDHVAGPDSGRVERTSSALVKRLMLDAEIAIRHYIDCRERELRTLNSELRRAGRALSREVDETSRDLRRTEARARAAEQLASVATIVSGLAHEVGTPMGVIRGHAEALEGAVKGERAQWRLQMILSQIDRITHIIRSLLNLGRPRKALRIPFDLDEVLDTSLAFLSEKLKAHSVRVERKVDDIPHVMGDPEKIQQVFLNLFINAIDAMGKGGVLEVELGPGTDSMALVRVADSGAGIPPERLSAVFEPFYTTKAAGHGSGLGLVVVKGIVEEHGGEIEVRSQAGEGTEFLIQLPVAETAASSDAAPK